jgi:vacuolar-type H+-ATPase subunit H
MISIEEIKETETKALQAIEKAKQDAEKIIY